MAAVYSATHRNGARAALKILHPTLCADASVCERFLGEGYLTNSVKHSGIVRVLDDGVTDDGCVFLVMDLLDGVTLETRRQERGGQIGLGEVFDIADKLMDVLRAVHEKDIIHRDLKPQNVFICNDATVKLLDFGVARGFAREQGKASVFGLVLGTPSFMSPEQALGSRDDVDHRSDIWSLGATLFTAITGQTVHLGPNVQARLLAAASAKARSIQMAKPDLPAPLANAIDMALRFERKERWQTVEAFQRSMREIRAKLGFSHAPLHGRDVIEEPTLPLVAAAHGRRPPPLPMVLPARRAHAHGPNGTFVGIAPLDTHGASPEANGATTMRMRAAPSYDDILAAPVLPAPHTPPTPLHSVAPLAPFSLSGTLSDDDAPLSFSKIDVDPSYPLPKRSRLGVWLGAVVAIMGASGVAFYAVDRSPRSDGTTGERDPVTLTAGGSTTAIAKSGQSSALTEAKAEPSNDVPTPAPSASMPEAGVRAGEANANAYQAKVVYSPAPKPNASVRAAHSALYADGDRSRPNGWGAAPNSAGGQRGTSASSPASEPTSEPGQAQRSAGNQANAASAAVGGASNAAAPASAPSLAPDPFGTPD